METMTPDWQQKFTDIRSRNLHSLSNGILSDCKFLVGNDNKKKIIPAHKLILALASPVFERMFYGELAEKCDPIVVSDVQPDSFKLMLKYIYSDRLELNSLRKTFELYYLGDKYMLPDMQKQCTDYIYSNTNVCNACHCYEFAEMFQLANLKEKSMKVIINITSEILKQPNFTENSMSTLMFILDQDRLNISSEMELFDALLRFANKRVLFGDSKGMNVEQKSTKTIKDPFQELICRVSDLNNSNLNNSTGKVKTRINVTRCSDLNTMSVNKTNDLIKEEQFKEAVNKTMSVNKTNNLIKEEVFKEAVKKIRFLTMTPQQFADGPAVSKLLTKDEILTFFLLISKSNRNQIPIPKGFSNSNAKRSLQNNNYYNYYNY